MALSSNKKKRNNTSIGDIFSVKINDRQKKYFQLIAFDLTQLNSDVIRAFKRIYNLDESPDLSSIIDDEIDFYTHCVTKLGLKMELWEKVGNDSDVGETEHILFRATEDYGVKQGEEPIKVSNNWYIWQINDKDFTDVGKLKGENRKAEIGIVINPLGVIELMKGNKYPVNYPDFE